MVNLTGSAINAERLNTSKPGYKYRNIKYVYEK